MAREQEFQMGNFKRCLRNEPNKADKKKPEKCDETHPTRCSLPFLHSHNAAEHRLDWQTLQTRWKIPWAVVPRSRT